MSKSKAEYAENSDGVHLVNPLGSEHTMCGDAFDRDSESGDDGEAWVLTDKRTVTCPKCIAVIMDCRGVRVSAIRKHYPERVEKGKR